MTDRTRRRPSGGGVSSFGTLLYLVGLAAALASILVWGGLEETLASRPVPFVVLLLLASLGSAKRVVRAVPYLSQSIVSIVLLAAAALVGPAGAAVIGIVSSAIPSPGRQPPWRVRTFNVLSVGVLGGAAGFAYLATGGLLPIPPVPTINTALGRVALPFLAADLVLLLLNALLIGIMAALEQGANAMRFAWGLVRGGGLEYLGHGIIGFMLAFLWAAVNLELGALVLVVGPLLVAQWASEQAGTEAVSHERTVAALVAAAEAENIYTAGHSERVAALTAVMARVAGRDGEQRRVLRMASLLHDIGTASISSSAWRGSPPYTESEARVYMEHPRRGVEMLAGISFLEDALPAIELHHERYDGSGYPYGYVGQEIPWDARAIAVADAYDSLTSTRSYRAALTRDSAILRLRALGGTHLDPALVEVLATALSRAEVALPDTLDQETIDDFGPAKDHDDPDFAIRLDTRGGRRG